MDNYYNLVVYLHIACTYCVHANNTLFIGYSFETVLIVQVEYVY